MKSFLHGIGGGVGRVFGRIIGLLLVALIGYLIINYSGLDLKNYVLKNILFLNVHAAEIDNDITAAIYTGTENCVQSQTGVCALGEFTTGDAGSRIQFNEWRGGAGDGIYSISFQVNTTIRANMVTTLKLSGNQFGNHRYICMSNYYSCQVVRVSSSQLNINFTSGASVRTDALFFITTENAPISWSGNNLIRFTSMRLLQNPVSTDPGSTFDDTGIINNANQNTQDIINADNQNTQDIIDANDENTTSIINALSDANLEIISGLDSLSEGLTCPSGPQPLYYDQLGWTTGKKLDSNGNEVALANTAITPYLQVLPNTDYSINYSGDLPSGLYYCTYTTNKVKQSCYTFRSGSGRLTDTFTTSGYTGYLRVSLRNSRLTILKGPVCNNWEKEAQDEANRRLSEIGNGMFNSGVDSDLGSNYFSNFSNNNHGLSSIITIPLSTIESLSTTSCSTLRLPIPFAQNQFIDLPCMKDVYQREVPDLYSLWYAVSYGLIAYWICLDIFRMVKGFKDPGQDKVEVVDL